MKGSSCTLENSGFHAANRLLTSIRLEQCSISSDSAGPFASRMDVTCVGRTYILGAEFSGATELAVENPGAYHTLCWALQGSALLTCSTGNWPLNFSSAAISPPSEPFSLSIAPSAYLMLLRVEGDCLVRTLQSLASQLAAGPLQFHNPIDMSKTAIGQLGRFLSILAENTAIEDGLLGHPSGAKIAEHALLSWLLVTLPHNCRSLLNGRSGAGVPQRILRVEEYIQQNASSPLSLADIAKRENVSLRGLQTLFHKHRGYSPSEFLKKTRLNAVRQAILKGDGRSVTTIAYDAGFTRMGAFASAYQAQFGELPSATMKRIKGAASTAGSPGSKGT